MIDKSLIDKNFYINILTMHTDCEWDNHYVTFEVYNSEGSTDFIYPIRNHADQYFGILCFLNRDSALRFILKEEPAADTNEDLKKLAEFGISGVKFSLTSEDLDDDVDVNVVGFGEVEEKGLTKRFSMMMIDHLNQEVIHKEPLEPDTIFPYGITIFELDTACCTADALYPYLEKILFFHEYESSYTGKSEFMTPLESEDLSRPIFLIFPNEEFARDYLTKFSKTLGKPFEKITPDALAIEIYSENGGFTCKTEAFGKVRSYSKKRVKEIVRAFLNEIIHLSEIARDGKLDEID